MNLSNIKLIVSDMDGTLLNSKEQVSDLFFEQFEQLQKLGVHFVAASGRQYHSITNKLASIKDEITIIAENGGMAKRKDELLVMQTLESETIAKMIPQLRAIEGMFIILCGEDSAYVETQNPQFIHLLQEYYNSYKQVEDLTKVVNDSHFLKVALYHPKSSEKYIYPYIKHLGKDLLLKISGKHWLDISNTSANKGNALKVVQEQFNVSPAETLVFGDYLNDIEMLELAHFSYAMKNSHELVKEVAQFSTESNDDFGVEKVLQKLIEAKSF